MNVKLMRSTRAMTAPRSSLLASMRYSPQATLDLAFRSDAVYRDFTVPRAIVEGLRAADSKGAYFNPHIKDHVPYQRLV